jgi:hypothetical protein
MQNVMVKGTMAHDWMKSTGEIRNGDVVHTSAKSKNWDDLWCEIIRENQKSYSVTILTGPNAGKRATISKSIATPYFRPTVETAKLKNDRKVEKVDVKAELEAARAALVPDNDDDDDDDDDTPVPVRRVRKVAPAAAPKTSKVKAAMTTPSPVAPKVGKRRILRRG